MIPNARKLFPIQYATSSMTDPSMGINPYFKHPLGRSHICPQITSWASISINYQRTHKIWSRVLKFKKWAYCSRVLRISFGLRQLKFSAFFLFSYLKIKYRYVLEDDIFVYSGE